VTSVQPRAYIAVAMVSLAIAFAASASPAMAFNPLKPICSAAGLFSGFVGKACSLVQHGGRLLTASGKLVTGNVSGAAKSLLGEKGTSIASKATTALALVAIVAWVAGGASYVLRETSSVLGETTAPQLTSTWFSATYWRVAGIAAVLTLPFLFAAAIQALVQSDITLLARAALGYLPLAALAIAVAAPLTMLLLAASDQLAGVVSSAAGHESGRFLGAQSGLIGALTNASSSPFLAFFLALLTVAAAMGLWIELLMRAAAVYVIVLMLPLAFAAFVWPARRIWAIRAIELLIALILSKFAIVAVLSLGAAALGQSVHHSVVGILAGAVLLGLAAFAPWALLRLLPLTEIASAAAGSLRHEGRSALGGAQQADAAATEGDMWASTAAQMRREAGEAERLDAARAAKEQLDASSPAAGPPAPGSATTAAPAPGSATAAAPAPQPVTDDGERERDAKTPNMEEVASRSVAEGGNGAAASPVAPRVADAGGTARAERIPGLGPIWQAKNRTWNPVTLGLEDSQASEPEQQPAGMRADAEAPAGDHPDPSPPPQEPQDGRL
jgi:hypothetical protein